MLKQHMLQMQLVSNNQSVFYQSEVFSKIIAYVMNHSRVCDMREGESLPLCSHRDQLTYAL